MAVQQNHTSRSKRNMRRSHDALSPIALSHEKATGDVARRHNVTASGYYRGKKVINKD